MCQNKVIFEFMFNSLRFYISWIASAIFMYVAFYIWHGIFLNDLARISFSKVLFMVLAALVYLIISFIVYKTFDSKLLGKLFYPPLIRGVASGIIVGFALFSITTVLGISFTKHQFYLYDC